MKSRISLAIVAAGGLAAVLVLVAVVAMLRPAAKPPERLQPGRWAVATGLNGQTLGTPTSTCITAQDALAANGTEDDIAAAARREGAAQSCRVTQVLIAGPAITVDMVCQGQPARSSMVYRGTSYEGTMATGIGRPNARVIAMKGQRIGDC
ncbi:DUF3617 domain-containing protein [Phreatobacter stygius]|nr:DUF3617 family protein [Phreatobacter stygius]